MLKQHEQTPGPDAQTRVSPQELMQAVADLEARRQAESATGAVPLGEAVEALNLPESAEEVLAEVEAQRARLAVPPAPGRRGHFLPLLLTVSLVGNVLAVGRLVTPPPVTRPAPVAPPAARTIVPDLKPLTAVRIGQTFHCDRDTLLDIAGGKADAVVDIGPASQDLWTVVRAQKGLMLQAWADGPDVLALANGRAGAIQSAPDHAQGISPVAIPLERLRGAQRIFNSDGLIIAARPVSRAAPKETP